MTLHIMLIHNGQSNNTLAYLSDLIDRRRFSGRGGESRGRPREAGSARRGNVLAAGPPRRLRHHSTAAAVFFAGHKPKVVVTELWLEAVGEGELPGDLGSDGAVVGLGDEAGGTHVGQAVG